MLGEIKGRYNAIRAKFKIAIGHHAWLARSVLKKQLKSLTDESESKRYRAAIEEAYEKKIPQLAPLDPPPPAQIRDAR
jgi:hypothetical protein